MRFEIYPVHSPTNTLFINLVKSFKFTLQYTMVSLLHVLAFNGHHERALSVPNQSYIYVMSYKLGDVAACRRAAHAALRHAATSPNLYNDVILPRVLTRSQPAILIPRGVKMPSI